MNKWARNFLVVCWIYLVFSSSQVVQHASAEFINPTPSDQTQTSHPTLYPGSDIRFFNYTAEEGLSMSVVNSIAQDQRGFLWFGTQDGLNRIEENLTPS